MNQKIDDSDPEVARYLLRRSLLGTQQANRLKSYSNGTEPARNYSGGTAWKKKC
jgi:hypothetical protein